MTPTVLRHKNYRLFFFSREEIRMHVHVTSPEGQAKFWLEPVIALAYFAGYSPRQLKEIQKVIEEHEDEIAKAWKTHFGS